jgi:hypothetical protein
MAKCWTTSDRVVEADLVGDGVVEAELEGEGEPWATHSANHWME